MTATRAWRPLHRLAGLAVVLLGAAAAFGTHVASAQPAATAATAARPVSLAQEQLRQGRAQEALATVEAALAAQPRDAALRFLRGVALMDLRRDTLAAQAFTALTEEYPELPEPWNNLALLHVRAGQPEQARVALEVALRNNPSHHTARLNLGEVHLMLAAQSWAHAARTAALSPTQAQRLQAVRQLLATPLAAR